MTAIPLGVPPARSRQEVVELINFLDASSRELEKITARTEAAIVDAKAKAEALASPLRAAVAEATVKVQAWFRVHPETVSMVPGSEAFIDPVEAQLTAVVATTARRLTERQVKILECLKEGMVLRRGNPRQRSYSLFWTDRPNGVGRMVINTAQVFDLQARYLDAHDIQTGDRLLGVSAYDPRAVEFRIKPGVVLS